MSGGEPGGGGGRVFRTEPLPAIIAYVQTCIARGEPIAFCVLDPERGAGRYAGELVDGYKHRPFRVWVDLAERLGLRLLTPRRLERDGGLVQLRFEPLARRTAPSAGDVTERYGAASEFARVDKLEDPGFVLDLADALERVQLPAAPRVLDLGVGAGGELALVLARYPAAQIVGVDHSASALAVARARYADRADPEHQLQLQLIEADLAALPSGLGRFDLVLSIGTLQSGALDDRALLRQLVQDYLAPAGAIIFGVPNCRYVDGEVEYGARMKNFRQPELGLVIKDIAFYRKYLQQHHRQVYVTGKHYLFVTAVTAVTAVAASSERETD